MQENMQQSVIQLQWQKLDKKASNYVTVYNIQLFRKGKIFIFVTYMDPPVASFSQVQELYQMSQC